MAKFEIKTSFKLSSRNILVLGGEITEGTISIGDLVWFLDENQDYERKLVGIEAIDVGIGRSNYFSHVGLVIKDQVDKIDPQSITKKEVLKLRKK